jgi:amino acid permease
MFGKFGKSDDNIVTTDGADVENAPPSPPHGRRIVERQEDRDLSRSLKQRHIQMIALAGAIVSFIPAPRKKSTQN